MEKKELLNQLKKSGKSLEEVLTCSDCGAKCFEGEQLAEVIGEVGSLEEFLGACEDKRQYDHDMLTMLQSVGTAAAIASASQHSLGEFLELCVDAFLDIDGAEEEEEPETEAGEAPEGPRVLN